MTTVAARPLGATFEAPGADGIGRILIDRPDDQINALNEALIEALGLAIREARALADLRGLIIVSAKPDQWVAGADLKLVTDEATTAADMELASRRFQAVCDELAWLPCATVAAINGAALGGGLELALACDYRVALDGAKVSLGQPEVQIGLVPAGGGTQRLPRLIGLPKALDLLLSGRRLNARRARRMGLLDEVVHAAVLDEAARAWARKPKRPLDRPLTLGLSLQAATDVAEQTPAGRQLLYRQARSAVLGRTKGHYPAPLKALEAVEIGLERGMAAGLDAEAKAFGELATGDIAHNLIWLFMATQRQRRQKVGAPRPVERLGVVGAGFMGAAIAEVAAVNGLSTRVRDVQPEAVAKGLSRIRGMVERRYRGRESRDILQRVSATSDYAGFPMVNLVIEAVFEDVAVKHKVIAELEAAVGEDTVIASNTSALPIRQVAEHAQHPERIVGMHFFSPAERMPLLEVIRPARAAEWAVATAVSTGVKMGKTVIVVGDTPGFYTSRVLGVMLNEATVLLREGAQMVDVDRAVLDFGFPVGPFVLYDEVGLEVALHAGETVTSAFGDRIPALPVVPGLVASGAVGKRVGRGFYLWPTPPRLPVRLPGFLSGSKRPNPDVARLVGNPTPKTFEQSELQDRLVLLFVNEALRCLDEGVLTSPTDGDLGAVLGLGFPPFRGGPFHYADAVGLRTLEQRLQRLADQHGPRYAPANVLVDKARAGGAFFAE